ncbi:methyltransferase [Streptomyces sp. YC537]|uniref:Methyltransferase n=2 Tax=Streptomyces boluensis TaxID=1775135 RepID=A0A964UJR3_9ACTN|nr:methyltransferase [Streptomyces boluensis]
MTTQPLIAPTAVAALRDALTAHGYTREGIVTRVGIEAAQGLNRYDPTLTLQLLGKDDPLAVLIQLFMCGRAVPLDDVEPAVVPLLESTGDGAVRASVHLHPYDKWWAISDFPTFLRPDPQDRRADAVAPIGLDATLLRRATLTHRVASALDLGTGGGVQALHLSGQAERVTATDLSPRAARFAATTAALNGFDWEILQGDMAQPVAGRRFDLVVSNPPYAVGPGTVHSEHRDSGRPGDALCAELAGSAGELLTEGGHLQFRAHWVHRAGEDWRERVGGWIPQGAGLDAWIVQRSVTGVVPYVDQWLELSGGEEALGQREAWLRWFETQKIEAIGAGTVVVRRSGHRNTLVRVEELSPEAGELTGAQVAGWFTRRDWLRAHDPLAARYVPGQGLTLWQQADQRGGTGWELTRQVLKVPGDGLNWSERVTPLAVALLGGAGREATLGEQLTRIAEAEGADPERLAEAAMPEVTRLVERGALVPAELPEPG